MMARAWRPASLFARNAVLLAALLIVCQAGAALLVRQLVLKPRLERIADGLAQTVHGIRAGLVSLPPAAREPFVKSFNRQALANIGDDVAAVGPGRVDATLTPLQRSFVRALSKRIAADDAQVTWRQEAGGSLSLRMRIDGETHWLMLPGVVPTREFSGAWVVASLCAVALALAAALMIQRRLNRPLQRVVDAAASLARGATPARLAEDGPIETATLSSSINRLVASLGAADRERALMLAGVSHDLRTPMTKLRLGIEIASDAIEPELMASMARSIEEMDAIVGQFLDFARVGEGMGEEMGEGTGEGMRNGLRGAEPMTGCDLDALVRELVRAAADHGRTIDFDAGHPPPLRLQSMAFRRAIGNLIENAFRHGEAPVSMRTGASEGRAWVDVIDHGVGIDPAEAEAMKQPFRRAGSARAGVAGAGLGLAIVERVARAHGGTLELVAVQPGRPEGQGLRARLSMPIGR